MISLYKWKKQAVFMLLGIIPLMLFLLFFLTSIKYFELEGFQFTYVDPFSILLAGIVAVVAMIIIMIIGNRWLRHAFTAMLEGKGLITFIIDSTGVIGSFNVKVNAPKMESAFTDKKLTKIEDIYDTDLLHRLMVPKDTTMDKAYPFEPDGSGGVKIGKPVNVLVLPDEKDTSKHLFSFENRPVFIFNKVMNKFLSRDALAKFEKDIMIKHNALNVLTTVQETARSFRDFGRYIGENIKPLKKALFGSNLVKYIVIAAIIGLVIFILALFVPAFLSAGSNISLP